MEGASSPVLGAIFTIRACRFVFFRASLLIKLPQARWWSDRPASSRNWWRTPSTPVRNGLRSPWKVVEWIASWWRTMAAVLPQTNFRLPLQAMPPARFLRPMILPPSAPWAFAAKRSLPSPAFRAFQSPVESPGATLAPASKWMAALPVKCVQPAVQSVRWLKCGSCFTTCQRDESSCARQARNWDALKKYWNRLLSAAPTLHFGL